MKKRFIKLLELIAQYANEKDIIEISKTQNSIVGYLEELQNESVDFRGNVKGSFFTDFESHQNIIYKKKNGNWIIKVYLIRQYIIENHGKMVK